MRDRITSATITKLTYENAQNPPAPTVPVPPPETIIAQIFDRLDKIRRGELHEQNISADKADAIAKNLQALLDDLPEGLTLATVAYSKIPTEKSRQALDEFGNRVKPRFYAFLAENRRDDLRAMGICDYGIERMRNGFAPADEKGRLYGVSVDHIIERAGSGAFGLTSEVDPDMEAIENGNGSTETLLVNHIRNLILLPNAVHFDCKNLINDLQGLGAIFQSGTFQWTVMLVPKDGPDAPMHLYVPAAHQKDKYGLAFKDKKPEDMLGHTSYVMLRLDNAVKKFNATRYGQALSQMCSEMATARNTTVEALLRNQQRSAANDNSAAAERIPLKYHFHQALYGYGPKQSRQQYDKILELAREAEENIRKSFNEAAKLKEKTGKTYALKGVQEFLSSNKFNARRHRLACVPEIRVGSVDNLLGNVDEYKKEIQRLLNEKQKGQKKSTKPQKNPPSKKKNFSGKSNSHRKANSRKKNNGPQPHW